MEMHKSRTDCISKTLLTPPAHYSYTALTFTLRLSSTIHKVSSVVVEVIELTNGVQGLDSEPTFLGSCYK
jgi:hypothetical protein